MGVPAGGSVPAVAVAPDYITTDQLKNYLAGANASNVDSDLAVLAAAAASRAVDELCGRRFWLDDTATARTYTASRYDRVDVDDIGSLDDLEVAVDTTGGGSYTTVWLAAHYQLHPVNAPYASPEPEPWTRIVGITQSFPVVYGTGRANRVQVTARWGWPAVPTLVQQATLIKAGRVYHRRNSPQGVAAFDEFGPVRISRAEDGDVVSMLEGYRRQAVLMA